MGGEWDERKERKTEEERQGIRKEDGERGRDNKQTQTDRC